MIGSNGHFSSIFWEILGLVQNEWNGLKNTEGNQFLLLVEGSSKTFFTANKGLWQGNSLSLALLYL